MELQEQKIHESKYGFHPCDIETYKLLKKARYYYHVYCLQSNEYNRWKRKLPHNRLKWHKQDGKWVSTVWQEPKFPKLDVNLFYLEYRKTLPVNSKEEVQSLMFTLDEIKNMVSIFEEWLISINRHER